MLYSPKEKGQGWVEFALIIILVAIVIIAVIEILRPAIMEWIKEFFPQ